MAYQKIVILDAQGNLVGPSIDFGNDTQKTVTIAYQSDEANLSGVGVAFNFDASGLSVVSVDNVYTGAIASGDQSGVGNDQELAFGWASLFGQFPGSVTGDADSSSTNYSNALTLATVTLEKVGDNTDVTLDYTSSAAGVETINLNAAPATPLEINEIAIEENSGEGQVIATVENGDNGATYSLVDNTVYSGGDDSAPSAPVAPEQQADTQHVYISDSQFSDDGSQLTVTLAYMSDEANSTGVGPNIHFDSSVLSVNSIDNVFAGAISSGNETSDSNDADSDASTDTALGFSWASVFGQFPGANSADLATITFDVIDPSAGSTELGISATSNAAGFAFDGQGFTVHMPVVSPLSIDSATGEVTLSVNPDFESVPEYKFDIVDDSGRTGSATVSITNADEQPAVFDNPTATNTVAEDADVIFTAQANDSADISAGVTYSLSGDDASLLSINSAGEVTVNGGADFETKTSYSFTVNVTDGINDPVAESSQDVTVNISNVDDSAPIFDSAATASVVENTTGVVYQAAATDDATDVTSGPITYSLVDDANGLFTIDGSGNVSITAAQDYENSTALSFTVRAEDGEGNSADQAVSVTVENADEIGPSITSAATANINEDTNITPMPEGTVVYTATAVDSDADVKADGDITFSLGEGSDSRVQISDDGKVTLTDKPDFESATNSYTFSVIATDAAGNAGPAQEVTLTVVDGPDSKPSWQSSDNANPVDENSNPGVVYTASANAVSPNNDTTIASYELVDDANGLFSIDATTGAVSFNGDLDHEATPSYSFTLKATDSAGNESDTKTVTLSVNDLDEKAPIVSGQVGSVNLTNGTGTNQVIFDPSNPVLGESAIDDASDVSDGLVFTLSFDADNQQYADDFAINSSTGQVIYKPDPNGSLTINYSVVVTDQAGNIAVDQDGNQVDAIPLSITILDTEFNVPIFNAPDGYTADVIVKAVQNEGTVNEAYVDTVQSVVKDSDLSGVASGDVIYIPDATDATAQLSYSVTPAILVGENTSTADAVYSANAAGSVSVDLLGNVSIHGQPWADGAESYSFTVTATDSSGNSSYQIVTLSDLNGYTGSPVDNADATYSLQEVDGFPLETQGLGIDPASGDVYFVDTADYEAKDHYVFNVVATYANGDAASTQQVNLHVVNADDTAPVITLEGTATSVDESVASDENPESGFVVTTVKTSDESAVTLSLSGDDADSFAIDSDGVVTLEVSADHESQSEYNFNVVATDSEGNSSEEAVSLQVSDLDELGPVFTSADTVQIDEQDDVSHVIYTAAAHDSGNLVSSGAIAQEFVQNADGTLTVKLSVDSSVYSTLTHLEVADFDFSFEADHHGILAVESVEFPSNPMFKVINDEVDGQINFALILRSSNLYEVGGDVALAEVTFKVGDPTVAATFSVSNVSLGDSNGAQSQEGATVNQYVMDGSSDQITFSLTNSDGFSIDAEGNVSVDDANFEDGSEQSFTVVATDGQGNASSKEVTVSINNLDEVAPTIDSGAVAAAIDENSGSGQVVYTATSDDSADISAGVTYSLSGDDAGSFTIDAQSGEVTLLDNPDYETQSNYSFDVIAHDGKNTSTESVTLAINNLDEVAPTINTTFDIGSVDENSGFGVDAVIYSVSADDSMDASDGVTFSLASTNSDALVITDSGDVYLNVAANHELLAQYSFTVVATDAAGHSSRKAVTVDVNDIDEVKPVFTSGNTALNIDENAAVEGVVVYKAIADDSNDIGDRNDIRYDFAIGGDENYFNIDSISGEVTLKDSPDFETKSDYSFTVTASDARGNKQFSNNISLKINDLDEVAPAITSDNSAGSIVENSGTNQLVYTATATDIHSHEATSDGFVFALSGVDADAFTIDAETGEVRLIDNPDQDDKDSYSFSVLATDAANNVSTEQAVTLTVSPESQIVVAHLGSNDHISNVKISSDDVVKGVSNGRQSTAIDVDESTANLAIDKDVEAADISGVVNSADALTVLKMAIGLGDTSAGKVYKYDANLDFDGDSTVNDLDLRQVAADINNDGKVNSRDALEILKISVRMDDALDSGWMFVEEQAESNAVQDTVTYKGFVKGDVNSSWNNSENVDSTRSTDSGAEFTSANSIKIYDDAAGAIYKAAADDDTYEVTYKLVVREEGQEVQYVTDHNGFSISASGVVSVASVTAGQTSFELAATDAHNNITTQTVNVDVAVKDTLPPVITVDGSFDGRVDESNSENQVVYKVNSDAVEYKLGAGSDPALSINDQGEVTLSNKADEDIQSEYHFTIIARDEAGNESKEAHVIEVVAKDEVAPVIVSDDSAASIDENSSGQVIYTVKATDSDHDGQENVHYHLKDSPEGLSINNVTGEVSLTGAVDFESQNEITFTVIAEDGVNDSEKEVTIAINDLDEKAPEITSSTSVASIDENSGAGQLVYTAKADDTFNDEARSEGVTFGLSGVDAGSFTIDAKSGEVRLIDNPNYEDKSEYNFNVEAKDSADHVSSQSLTLSINDIDEIAPVITLNLADVDSDAVAENSDSGHIAYTVSASDDSDFNLVLSSDSDKAVSLENGNIVLNVSPDHEMQREYKFKVIATDAEGNSSSVTDSISVVDVDDAAPTIKSESSSTVVEGNQSGDVVYRVAADDDADSVSSADVNYSILAGKGGKQEVIDDTQLVFVGSDTVQKGNEIDVAVNYLADSSDLSGLGLRVHYDSSKLSFDSMNNVFDEDLIFSAEDHVNADNPEASYVSVAWASLDGDWTGGELPELLFNAKFEVVASEATTSEISFSAIDTAVGYDFASVSHELKLAPVTIDSQTGDVALAVEADYESSEELSFTVVAKDEAGNETLKDVVISVGNRDEQAPVIDSSNDAGVIVENSGAGQLIYTATSDDSADISQSSARYSLDNHDSSLVINSQTGDVYLLANPDYEAGDSITFTVVVTDDAGSSSKDVTLSVANVDEVGPTFVSSADVSSVDENSEAKLVYTAEAINDIDVEGITDHSVTYSLSDDSDSAFSIDADSGDVVFNESANYEAQNLYNFTVVATDAAGNSSERSLSLSINNLDEQAPEFSENSIASSADENSDTFSLLVSAYDGNDTSDGVNYHLIGEDAELFNVNNSGVINQNDDTEFDYEAKSEYNFTVVASDEAGNSSADGQQDVTVSINDLDEVNPVITSAGSAPAIDANHVGPIYIAEGSDADSGVTLSVEGNPDVEINQQGEVSLVDGATLSSTVDFTIRATDDGYYSNSVTKDVSIDVIHAVDTVSPTLIPDVDNNGLVHTYTNNSDGTITLSLSISANTGFADEYLTNLDFNLSYNSAVVGMVDADQSNIAADPTLHIAVETAGMTDTLTVGQVYLDGYDTAAGLAIFEHTFNAPSEAVQGNLFSVSNLTIGSSDTSMNDSSSSITALPTNTGTDGDDLVRLEDGFANVDLGAGDDTFIIDPDYNANIVVDFASGEDSIDMTQILEAAGYGEGQALQVSGSTPDIADLISNSDESLDNAFGGYFNDDADVLTLFVDGSSDAGVTSIETIELTLSDSSSFEDEDLSVNFANFGTLIA